MRTSRDRLESTPYLRLAKGCQSVKVFSSAAPEKKLKKVSKSKKNWKGRPFGICQHQFCRKDPKTLKGDPLGNMDF